MRDPLRKNLLPLGSIGPRVRRFHSTRDHHGSYRRNIPCLNRILPMITDCRSELPIFDLNRTLRHSDFSIERPSTQVGRRRCHEPFVRIARFRKDAWLAICIARKWTAVQSVAPAQFSTRGMASARRGAARKFDFRVISPTGLY